MDDIIIYNETEPDNQRHVREVLGKLKQAGLTVNHNKCCWGGMTMEFLRHTVGNVCMTIPEKRVEA